MVKRSPTKLLLGFDRFQKPVRSFLIYSILLVILSCKKDKEDSEEEKKTFTDVVIIMADDMGYSDLGCYGSEIRTPNLDSLAYHGLRLTRFYNNAKCYPSRASLLTGVYPHRSGLGRNILHLGNPKIDKGPYQGWLDHSVLTIAEWLEGSSYKKYLSGKWHVGENNEDWPEQRGFDEYFGLVSGASSYFELIGGQKRTRQMVRDNKLWTPPDSGFYMTDAITDFAVESIRKTTLDSGIFMHVAYTAPHWPLHAPQEEIDRNKGQYDIGWNTIREQRFQRMKNMKIIDGLSKLPPAPESVRDWDLISDKPEWSRKMEVYAAMISRMDEGIGRIVEALKSRGNWKNTLFIFLSDNGASEENIEHRKLAQPDVPIGLQGSYTSYEEPWANVSNTPFRKYKLNLEEGGIRTPFIAHWPQVIQEPALNSSYLGHIMDLAPTTLDAIGYDAKQNSFDGKSMLRLFRGEHQNGHESLFWECQEQKVVLENQWKLLMGKDSVWALFNLKEDPYETMDVIEEYPERAKEMKMKYLDWATSVGI
ncbi:MAG: arylsulfatase [Bacteroidota bacterium]